MNNVTVLTTNSSGAYRLTLSRPITSGETTTVSYTDDNGLVTTGVFHSLPGDSNGDGVVSIADVENQLTLLGVLPASLGDPVPPPAEDIDRSGSLGPGDVLRIIDLMNGANGYDIGLGKMIPGCGVCCP